MVVCMNSPGTCEDTRLAWVRADGTGCAVDAAYAVDAVYAGR